MSNIIQEMYDKIKDWKAPEWLKKLLQELQDLTISIITTVGEDYLRQIEEKILEVSSKPIPSEDKFKEVFAYIRADLGLAHIKDSVLHLVIELIVNRLKRNRTI